MHVDAQSCALPGGTDGRFEEPAIFVLCHLKTGPFGGKVYHLRHPWLREGRAPVFRPNDVWAMDFVHDQLATGRKLRILTVVNTYPRLSPVVNLRFSYRGEDVVATLGQACREIGYPKAIRVDNGSESISRDIDLWAYQRGMALDISRPGKPTDNAFIGAINSKLRSECLSAHWLLSFQNSFEKLEAWRRHY